MRECSRESASYSYMCRESGGRGISTHNAEIVVAQPLTEIVAQAQLLKEHDSSLALAET